MGNGPQYNERSILQRFFKQESGGFLVEVGAADGLDNSHTEFLIRERGWKALLIEPHPEFFAALMDRYCDNENVMLSDAGVLSEPGTHTLYLNGQISRFMKKPHGFQHTGSVDVECFTLTELCESFGVPYDFDFLTVDAETKDIEALESLDWTRWKPRLVCAEHMFPEQLNKFFADKPYHKFDKNIGNTFYARKNKP